ncbi:damage-control phosphatase ARMT1 family protein [Maridesulfovibrio sp.]|uniref:damage-control phosphatase ARMT1 family protein n=1 Tax=Maridesulfovibrio sp. TaxID=2795000 RepID=UPI002AA95DC0|nr:ARMT1-like domain-containing protein [Maridesulfovibrio sp.]
MRTHLECLPCFLKMALTGIRAVCPGQEEIHEKVIKHWAAGFANADLSESPPSLAGRLFRETSEYVGEVDIFKYQKEASNKRVLELLPEVKARVLGSEVPLLASMGVSIIGNYMDCAVMGEYDWEGELDHMEHGLDLDVFNKFLDEVRTHKSLLVLGDNAGEIGLDTILAGLLRDEGIAVTYAVRGKNILNDATVVDAEIVGMTDVCEVVTSGVDTPGTVLNRCSDEFRKRLENSPVVLSKGQGNFESLWGVMPDVYYAFKVKCPVVADVTGVPVKTSLFCQEK